MIIINIKNIYIIIWQIKKNKYNSMYNLYYDLKHKNDNKNKNTKSN